MEGPKIAERWWFEGKVAILRYGKFLSPLCCVFFLIILCNKKSKQSPSITESARPHFDNV